MLRRILSLLAPALLALSPGAASELDDLAAALRKGGEVLASAPAGEKLPDPAQQQRLAETLRLLTEFDQALVRGDVSAAQTSAGRLEINPMLPQPLRETAGRFRRELPALFEAREDAFVATVDKLVTQTREQCLGAKKEADLEPLLRELSRLGQGKSVSRSPYMERAVRKLNAAVALVRGEMDYLAAKEAGDLMRAGAALQPFSDSNPADRYPILPAAEIRRRMEEVNVNTRPRAHSPAELQALLARIKTLRDVPEIAKEIAAFPVFSSGGIGGEAEQDSLRYWFARFATATGALLSDALNDAWKLTTTELSNMGAESWAVEAFRLRSLLIGELAAKSLQLTPAQARRADETTADHLLRIVREAAREHRWEDVERIQKLYGTLSGRAFYETLAPWWADTADLAATYLQGRRLEEAGDSKAAAAAYLRVLRGSGEFVPTDEAQERLRALLAAQKTTLSEVRMQLDSDRLIEIMQRLETNLDDLKKRSERANRQAQVNPAAAPAPADASAMAIARMDGRLKKVEAVAEKLGEAAIQRENFQTRLGKVETLFAPALEADPAKPGAADGKVRLWLGPDFTVYRSAVPPAVNARLDWIVRFNGKTVLSRTAKREMQFNYDGRQPGTYTIYLTEGGETPVSNVIDYTMTEEAAKKLGPRIIDDDFDRDGARNAPGPRGK